MDRWSFLRAHAFVVPREPFPALSSSSDTEHLLPAERECIFVGACCFVLPGADDGLLRPPFEPEIVYFDGGSLTPELGGPDDAQGSGEGQQHSPASDARDDATQLTCELWLAPSSSTVRGARTRPELWFRFDEIGVCRLEHSCIARLVDSGEAKSVRSDATPPDDPLPPYVQLDLGTILLQLYEGESTPADGPCSLACAREQLARLVDAAGGVHAAEARGAAGSASHPTSPAQPLEHVRAARAAWGPFVRAVQRVGPTYSLCALLDELGHERVDGVPAHGLTHRVLTAFADHHAASLLAHHDAAAACADAQRRLDVCMRAMRAQCDGLRSANAAATMSGAAGVLPDGAIADGALAGEDHCALALALLRELATAEALPKWRPKRRRLLLSVGGGL